MPGLKPTPPIPPPFLLPPGVAPSGAGALPLSGMTVLLVEDSRFAADVFRLMCQRSGARLRRAETLEQARAHLKTYRPDVVIVDLGLPDGRGDSLIRDLACMASGTVILGLSGDAGGRAAALAAGAVGFIEKPVPGLGAFQKLILHHMPGRFAPISQVDVGIGAADLLALHDDLAHAADLMAAAPDDAARRYLAGFVAGVARSAGDDDLACAARAAAQTDAALSRLRHMITERLETGVTI